MKKEMYTAGYHLGNGDDKDSIKRTLIMNRKAMYQSCTVRTNTHTHTRTYTRTHTHTCNVLAYQNGKMISLVTINTMANTTNSALQVLSHLA